MSLLLVNALYMFKKVLRASKGRTTRSGTRQRQLSYSNICRRGASEDLEMRNTLAGHVTQNVSSNSTVSAKQWQCT